jgi:hypothetical protein
MPTTVTPMPPPVPTISGQTLSMSVFLNSPAVVQRALENLASQRYLADRIFRPGPVANGGAVIYDQVTAQNLFTLRDVQEVRPGSEFPIVNGEEPNPLVALVAKYGGDAVFTYEQIRRNRRDVLQRELVRIRNTIVRKVDSLAIATLDAAPIQTLSASGDWTTAATDIIFDVEKGKSMLDAIDMGYEADTVILHTNQALDIRSDADIRLALPRENRSDNLLDLGAHDLNGLLGIPNWFVTNRVAAGTVRVLDSRFAGFISDEVAPYTRVIDEEVKERKRVRAARIPTMGVTDPKAVVKITGA